ncbi:hypothetical protein P308_29665 [Pseudomonas piscis]|nr:hypothetical protein P308_29665 [Pseudomonas piscis]
MDSRGWQADLLEQGREGVTLRDYDFSMSWSLGFFRDGRGWLAFGRFGGGLGCVVDLRKWRCNRLVCGLLDGCSVLILSQLLDRTFQIKTQCRFLCLDIAGRKYQQGQTEEGCYAAGGEQVALRIKRWRFRRFGAHR